MRREDCKPFKAASETAVRMMLHHPWMMVLYYSMSMFECSTTPFKTLCTNGTTIWIDPDFWAQLNRNQKVTAIAHEIGHKMLMHNTRRASRDPSIWNIAGDHVINLMLTESGFTPLQDMTIHGEPWSWFCDTRFAKMTTEQVYDILVQEYKDEEKKEGGSAGNDGKAGDSPGQGKGNGKPVDGRGRPGKGRSAGEIAKKDLGANADVVDFGEAPDGTKDESQADGRAPESSEDFEQRVRKELKEADTIAKMAGNAPAWMERVVGNAEMSKVKWYEVLEQHLTSMHRADYSWRRWAKREMVKIGAICPDLYEPAMGGIAVFVDCSGSIGGPTMDEFNSQLKAIFEQVKPAWVEVRYFECEVNHSLDHRFERGEVEVCLRPGGGGGTSFAWLSDELDEMSEPPDVAIMLTDMYGPFGHEPALPVVWVSVSAIDKAPFGEVVCV